MSGDNYITKLIVSAINELKTKQPAFPASWTKKQKNQFYDDILVFLEKEQLYEECQIVLDAKKKI
mgnify:CR=1 FL=1|tara:strand:- start:408 stop:602 length:195 start_codon:yes stop_codon:yes gene_type:complete